MQTAANPRPLDAITQRRRSNVVFRRVVGIGFSLFALVAIAVPHGFSPAFRLYTTPSGSMEPTIPTGGFVVGSYLSYGYTRHSFDWFDLPLSGRWPAARTPAAGDIVTLKLARDMQTTFVKRIVGLPGDRIQMIKGRLSRNGRIVDRVAAGTRSVMEYGALSKPAPVYVEQLTEGVSYTILEMSGDRGRLDDTEEFLVPAGHYFALGDNRDNSADSRVNPFSQGLGFIPADSIVSRIVFISRGFQP